MATAMTTSDWISAMTTAGLAGLTRQSSAIAIMGTV